MGRPPTHQDPFCTVPPGLGRRPETGVCPPPLQRGLQAQDSTPPMDPLAPGRVNRRLLRRTEDKHGPACSQENPITWQDPSPGLPQTTLWRFSRRKGVNKWDLLPCALGILPVTEHRGFRAHLAQAPPFTDEDTELERVRVTQRVCDGAEMRTPIPLLRWSGTVGMENPASGDSGG